MKTHFLPDTFGIYIHIPYCLRKCAYCDFLSFSGDCDSFDAYVCVLLEELRQNAEVMRKVDTVYIGGGTPTVLPAPLLCGILEAVKGFPLTEDVEITVEANPGTLNPEYLQALKAHGTNRLSIGLQATRPELLGSLGRAHTMADFTNNFHSARKAGFDNINVDLMFALPSQQIAHWQKTLQEIIALEPEHISAYSLIPAEGTPLWEKIKSGVIRLPDDALDRDMYHLARQILSEAGYKHYEISNFAKPGRESRHNINCWKLRPYIGFGLGAHSFDGRARWHNTENITEYLSGAPKKRDIMQLSNSDLIEEAMILGLRLSEGVPEQDFPLYKNEISKLVSDGLLTRNGGNIALTPYGMDLANRVFAEFLQ